MRSSIASTIWRFSTTRMLHEYTEQLYLPAAGVPIDRRTERKAAEPKAVDGQAVERSPASLGAG
jgi:hypothetical protein